MAQEHRDFALKNKYVFYQICGRYICCYMENIYVVVIYVADGIFNSLNKVFIILCYQSLISDAWMHGYINVQHICTLIRRAG